MEIQLGKRYGIVVDTGNKDEDGNPIMESTFEILCLKAGKDKDGKSIPIEADLTYDGQSLVQIVPKLLPSAD